MILKLSELKFYASLASMPFYKVLSVISMVFLFFSAAPASADATCRPYFIQTDALQKLSSEEYASLLISAETLGRLFGKTDPTSVDAKASINKQLLDLQRSKKFSADEHRYFLLFLRNKITDAGQPQSQRAQESAKRDIFSKQRDYVHRIKLILAKYKTSDVSEAFYFSSYENNFNNNTVDLQELRILLSAGADINYLHLDGLFGNWGYTALMTAAFNNNLRVMKFLIKANADLDFKNTEGMSALTIACNNKRTTRAAKLLIEQGAELNVVDASMHTPLMLASDIGASKTVDLLLKAKAGLDYQNSDGDTALILAINNHFNEIVHKLLDAGARIDLKTNTKYTALMMASESGNVTLPNGNDKIVERLISLGASINDVNVNAETALSLAVAHQDIAVVRLLIAAKANLDDKCGTGLTPLMKTITYHNDSIAKLLIQAGANLNIKNNADETVAVMAVEYQKYSLLEMLIAAKIDLNLPDLEGKSALFRAVQKGDAKSVEILIKAGANVNLQDRDGKSAIFFAVSQQDKKILQLLIEAGANINLQDILLSTPLMSASVRSNGDILELLIQAKPNLYLTDKRGYTVFDYAISSQNMNALRTYEKSLPRYRKFLDKTLNLLTRKRGGL